MPAEQSPKESLRIVSLSASNVKKITAVHIDPSGNVVTLSGPNGAGKSSVMDSIWYALGGKGNLPDQPIRRGASKLEIVLKLGNRQEVKFVVTRKVTGTGTTLTVANASGDVQPSPQAILDGIVGNLAFDPVAFVGMEPKQQLETLRKLVGLDFTKQDADYQRLYDERRAANRELESAKSRLNQCAVDPNAPKEEVSVASLLAKLEEANKLNARNQDSRNEEDDLKVAYFSLKTQHEKLQEQLRQVEASMSKSAYDWDSKKKSNESLKDVDTASLTMQISNCEVQNGKARQNARAKELRKEVDALSQKADGFTTKMDAIKKEKEDALESAKFPLPGLAFDDSGVLLNELPFNQASTGQQIRASVAIGMALNPQLRVIFVRNGSLLDDAGLKIISEMADNNDYQVWLETVRSDDPAALIFEDGAIVEKA